MALTRQYVIDFTFLSAKLTLAVAKEDNATILAVLGQLRDALSAHGSVDDAMAIEQSGLIQTLQMLVNNKDAKVVSAAMVVELEVRRLANAKKQKTTTASAAASTSNDVEVILCFTFPYDATIERAARICLRQTLGDNAGVVDHEYARINQGAPDPAGQRPHAIVLRQDTLPGDRWVALEASSGRLLVEYVATAEPEQTVVIQRASQSVGDLKEELADEKQNRSIKERQVKTLEAEKELLLAKLISPLPRLSHYARTGKVALDPSDQLYQMIEADFHQSARRHRRGPAGAPMLRQRLRGQPSFRVLRIEELRCFRFQAAYLPALDIVAGATGRAAGQSPPVAVLPDGVRRVQTLADAKLNEVMLYHGAPPQVIEKLQTGSFIPQFGGTNAGKLFGTGTYFAAHSSKSDQYATPNAAGERSILLARVCLGEPHYTDVPMREATLPPSRPDGGPPFDSVIAHSTAEGGCVQFPEYIVYEKAQMMPQFVITYTHAQGCKCASCVDPESSQIFVDVGTKVGEGISPMGIGEGTKIQFDVMPTTTFGELKAEIALYMALNQEEAYDCEPTVQKVDSVSFIKSAVHKPGHFEITDETRVLSRPISHGYILTLDVDDINDRVGFEVEFDLDYE